MPRQRPSVPPLGSSLVSSLSEASFHTTHESRRRMYPRLQARASDAGDSDSQRSSRSGFSGLLESVREDKQCEAPRHPSRRQPERALQTTESESGYPEYGSSVGWSIPSQASFSDHSLNPQDSISNQDSSSNGGFSSTGNSHIPQNSTSSRVYALHGRYRDDECYNPRYGARVRVVEQYDLGENNGDESNPRDRLAFYSEEPRTSRSQDGSGINTRLDVYDDDYEDPFVPRDHSDSDRESRYDHRDHMDDPHDNHDFNWEKYEA